MPDKLPDTAVVILPDHMTPDLWTKRVGGIPLFLRALIALKRAGTSRIHIIQSHNPALNSDLQAFALEANETSLNITFHPSLDPLPSRHFWLLPANLVWNDRLWLHFQVSMTALKNQEGTLIPLFNIDSTRVSNLADIILALQTQKKISTDILKDQSWHVFLPNKDLGIQVNDSSNAVKAQKMLFQTDFKHTDGIVSRHLNRPLSRKVSSLLIDTRISPNSISLIVFALGLIAIYFTQRGGYLSMLIGTIIFQLNSIADGIDGEIARIRYQDSRFGEWLDRILDKIVMVLFYVAILIGHMRFHQDNLFLIIGTCGVTGTGIGFALNYWYGYRFKHEIMGRIENPGGKIQEIADRAMAAMTFGSVDSHKSKPGSNRLDILKMLNMFMKNDVLGLLYLVPALAGILHVMIYILLPYALLIFPFGIYALIQLIRALFQSSLE